MVGHHKQQSLSVNLLHYATNQGIHTTVQLLDHFRPLLTRDASGSRMILFQVAPEHVLHAVRGIEDAGAQSLPRLLQRVKKHPLPIIMIAVALGEECLVVKHFFVQRPSIFRQSKGCVGAEELGEINGIGYRV